MILDAGGMEGAISEELLKCTTVISPNETELERMTGMPTQSDDEIHAAAFSLLDRGVEAVLLKLGAKGSVMLRSAGHRRVQFTMFATLVRILIGMTREKSITITTMISIMANILIIVFVILVVVMLSMTITTVMMRMLMWVLTKIHLED